MIKKGTILGICIYLLCILALLKGEFVARSYGNSYDLQKSDFWRLDLFSNLAGQFDGKEKFILKHTGVGFNEEVAVKKPAGVKRIIVLGTSSAEGYRVPRDKNFTTRLQYFLDSHYGNGKFEVINGAVGGRVSYQLLIYFQQVLLKLSPDIVILYLACNDTHQPGPFTARDYYEKVQKALLGVGNDHAKKERLVRYGLNGLCPLYPFLVESRLFGYLLVKTSKSFVKQVPLMPPRDQEYVLKEFVSLSKQYDFKLILAPEMVRRGSMENAVLPYYSLMRKVAEEERIPFMNMMPSFREYPDDKVFLEKDNVHLNPFGHQLAATEFFRQVQAAMGSDRAQEAPSSRLVG